MKRYFLAGLLFWLPVFATILVIRFLLELMDGTLALLPQEWLPEYWLGFNIPGFGLLLSLVILMITGLLVRNFIGTRVINAWDGLLARIPVVRSIYNAFKQLTQTLFSDQARSFRKVFLLEYPRTGVWTIVLQTNDVVPAFLPSQSDANKKWLAVYLPTTPNPTSGFLLWVSSDALIPLDISVDDALKMVISLGVIQAPSMVIS